MCTVSVVPLSNGLLFTFNRDEKPERYTPEFITNQQLAFKDIYYAKDSKTGGTWFGTDNLGNAAMLFNGAFVKHEKLAAYQKSRGIILLELLSQQNMLKYFKEINLYFVEPFSILLFENNNLYRLTWDGNEKYCTSLSKSNNYIFSSVTLYDNAIEQQRRHWLNNFLQQNQTTANNLLHFHSTYKAEDKQNGLIINRIGSCSTLSISQLVITSAEARIKHLDLISTKQYNCQIVFNTKNEFEIFVPQNM